jgi:hypothetical protein
VIIKNYDTLQYATYSRLAVIFQFFPALPVLQIPLSVSIPQFGRPGFTLEQKQQVKLLFYASSFLRLQLADEKTKKTLWTEWQLTFRREVFNFFVNVLPSLLASSLQYPNFAKTFCFLWNGPALRDVFTTCTPRGFELYRRTRIVSGPLISDKDLTSYWG